MRFSLSTHLFHGERLARAHLEAMAAAGFSDVEIFATRTHVDYHDRGRVHEVRRWLEELGLSAGSMHGPICDSFAAGKWGRSYSIASSDAARREEALTEMRAALESARVLGCRAFVIHLGLPEEQPVPPGDNDARFAGRSIETLLELAEGAGVQLALELIPNVLSTASSLVEWLDRDPDGGVPGVCLDLGHAHMLDGISHATDLLGGAILTTHLHDNNGREDAHLVPFEGSIAWPEALASLWKVGYDGALVFEVADRGNPGRVLERTVDARHRLQAILDDLAAPLAFEEG